MIVEPKWELNSRVKVHTLLLGMSFITFHGLMLTCGRPVAGPLGRGAFAGRNWEGLLFIGVKQNSALTIYRLFA